MFFANLMFLGVFVVLPAILFGFPASLFWYNYAARHHAAQMAKEPFSLRRILSRIFLPVFARACVANTLFTVLVRSINDTAEGDPPLQPFLNSVDGILIFSLIVTFPFVAGSAIRLYRSSQKKPPATEL